MELSIKETAVQALQETELDLNGYDEVKQLVAKVIRYQKQLSMLVDFGQKNQDKFLSTYGIGLTEDLVKKQAKMLFEFQLKSKLFKE